MSHFTIYKSRKGLPALFHTDSSSSQFDEDLVHGMPLLISFPPISVYVIHSCFNAHANTENKKNLNFNSWEASKKCR